MSTQVEVVCAEFSKPVITDDTDSKPENDHLSGFFLADEDRPAFVGDRMRMMLQQQESGPVRHNDGDCYPNGASFS